MTNKLSFNPFIPSNVKFTDSNFNGYSAWIHKYFYETLEPAEDISETFTEIREILHLYFNPNSKKMRNYLKRLHDRIQMLGQSPDMDSVLSIHQSLTNAILMADIPKEFSPWPTHITTAAGEILLNIWASHDLLGNQNSTKSDVESFIETSTDYAELNVSHSEFSREPNLDIDLNSTDSDKSIKPDTNDKPNQPTPTIKESVFDNNPTTPATLTTGEQSTRKTYWTQKEPAHRQEAYWTQRKDAYWTQWTCTRTQHSHLQIPKQDF